MWSIGKLPKGIITNEFKSINYIKEPFNDKSAIEEWTKKYGPIFDTGEMADYRQVQPSWTSKVIKHLGLDLAGSSYYRMNPGKILPYHSDTYARYIEYNKIEDPQTIHRAIIFLEDWKPGHIFEIDGFPINNYTAGTFVLWQYDTPHMAANLGEEDRYTLQITGIK